MTAGNLPTAHQEFTKKEPRVFIAERMSNHQLAMAPITVFIALFALFVLLYQPASGGTLSNRLWVILIFLVGLGGTWLDVYITRKIPNKIILTSERLVAKCAGGADLALRWNEVDVLRPGTLLEMVGFRIISRSRGLNILVPNDFIGYETLRWLIHDCARQANSRIQTLGFPSERPPLEMLEQAQQRAAWWAWQNRIRAKPGSRRGPIYITLGLITFGIGLWLYNARLTDARSATVITILGILVASFATAYWIADSTTASPCPERAHA